MEGDLDEQGSKPTTLVPFELIPVDAKSGPVQRKNVAASFLISIAALRSAAQRRPSPESTLPKSDWVCPASLQSKEMA